MDLQRRFNRNPVSEYTIAAGLSTTSKLILPPSTVPELVKPKSIVKRAMNTTRQVLGFVSPVSTVIPVAGTPLKAAIDTLLGVLNSIDTKDGNVETAALLIERLHEFHAFISSMPPATLRAQCQRDELARKLNDICAQLKQIPVGSVLRSADVKQAIADCAREMNETKQDYSVLALMRMEEKIQQMAQQMAQQLPSSIQLGIVNVKDATGREYPLLVDQCQTRKQFMDALVCYFKDDNRDIILREIVAQGTYNLGIQSNTGTTNINGWPKIQAGTKIIMSAVFEQLRHGEEYQCPRPQCRTWNDRKEANDGWIDW